MKDDLFSVEDVAGQLGLHVRTVRNYVRDGRLKAVRIGKQYRIAREDLEALTGRPMPAKDPPRRRRHVEVSTIVQIDAIDVAAAGRVTNTLLAATAGPREGDEALHVESVYDEERARLKLIILGGVATSGELLRLVGALVESGR